MQDRRLIPTSIHSTQANGSLVLQHEKIPFPSYPWEWSPRQWISAATLTLDLCEAAIHSDFILKDATPLNILFSGPDPVFVDVLSFERRDQNRPLWNAYAQFARTFLLPLAAYVYLGWPLSSSISRRDGYDPADLAQWLPLTRRLLNPLRSLVTAPLLFESAVFQKNASRIASLNHVDGELARGLLLRTLRRTRRLLGELSLPATRSRWSRYPETSTHYSAGDHLAKQDFVRAALERVRAVRVLDVGANVGVYSRIASEAGAQVVAWDTDPLATGLNWSNAQRDNKSILPIVADFARPTPAVGWQNKECASLLSRSNGAFDCALMLGIIHHIAVADQIPLPAILSQLADITTHWAILEWIPNQDEQFRGLARGRDSLYAHLTEPYFSHCLETHFYVRERLLLSNGRSLWLVEKRA